MKSYLKIILSILFFIPFGALAQIFSGGITGQVSTSSVKISSIPDHTVTMVDGKNITGYGAGLYLRGNLKPSPFYVKAMGLVTHQGGDVTLKYSDRSTTATWEMNRLEVPVLAGFRIIGPLSIEGGPVYNYILSMTKSFNGEQVNVKTSGLGYRVGANLQLGILGINAAYQGLQIGSSSTMSSFQSPDQLIFGASISFGGN